jgi:hypothetical protein
VSALALPVIPPRRIAGLIAVVLLHAAILAALLQATLWPRRIISSARETILILRPAEKPKPEKTIAAKPVPHKARGGVAGPIYPDYAHFHLAPTAPSGEAERGVGRALFDCRPENIAKLPVDERARCALSSTGMIPNRSVDFADHTDRSRDAARWARGRARKNAPLLLPCANPKALTIGIGTALCLAKGVIDGFDVEGQKGYQDREVETHVPNGGDPPPMYTEPDH